jgi:hypothetical protein
MAHADGGSARLRIAGVDLAARRVHPSTQGRTPHGPGRWLVRAANAGARPALVPVETITCGLPLRWLTRRIGPGLANRPARPTGGFAEPVTAHPVARRGQRDRSGLLVATRSGGRAGPAGQESPRERLVVTARAGKIPVVCVQLLLVRRAQEGEDFTRSRSGFGDAVIIARLTAELRCYLPYLPEGLWARLRHLGLFRRVRACSLVLGGGCGIRIHEDTCAP